jgi:hypothetical protein
MKVAQQEHTQTRPLSSPEVFDSQEIKDFLNDMIRADHPQWVADDGSCPDCDDYYEDLETAVVLQTVGEEY